MSLTVVGTGLTPTAHCSRQTLEQLSAAECLLYPADDPAGAWLKSVNSGAQACPSILDSILEALHSGQPVCAAFHGHPGAFRRASHEAVARARAGGYRAVMLPAVWAEDCLCAHLEVDPLDGWQAYEAANFLLHGRPWSPRRALVLWRLSAVWERDAVHCPARPRCLGILGEHLAQAYGPDHQALIYEPAGTSRSVSLSELAGPLLAADSILYVPALGATCSPPPGPAQLTLAGTGMEPGHVTLEAMQTVADSDQVFYLGDQAPTWLGPEARSLTLEPLAQLLREGRRATVVAPGHPAMGSPMRQLATLAREHGFSCRMLPGISPLGVLYAQLGYNPADGSQVFRGSLPSDYDPSAPALLVSEQSWVQPVSPTRVAQPDPQMLERLTAAAARENTEMLVAGLSERDQAELDSLVFQRLRALADDMGCPSVKSLKPKPVALIQLRATVDFATDRIVELSRALELDVTSPGMLLAYAAQHPESELARLAWLSAFSHKAWESLP